MDAQTSPFNLSEGVQHPLPPPESSPVVDLMHPETMSVAALLQALTLHGVPLAQDSESNKDALVALFRRFVMPRPQRQHRRSAMLNERQASQGLSSKSPLLLRIPESTNHETLQRITQLGFHQSKDAVDSNANRKRAASRQLTAADCAELPNTNATGAWVSCSNARQRHGDALLQSMPASPAADMVISALKHARLESPNSEADEPFTLPIQALPPSTLLSDEHRHVVERISTPSHPSPRPRRTRRLSDELQSAHQLSHAEAAASATLNLGTASSEESAYNLHQSKRMRWDSASEQTPNSDAFHSLGSADTTTAMELQ
ncbi:hypothetical protein CAOG_04390 [Capsaspora owczarzaki ATCC 30864]|uniref:Uncharacterized protein n=1 Tax=Capsaspora owczarzaki (strain ATCC 30864) TaxID=595528 RepID=A0A0D2WR77_CAPO3|nr:hypothetical protein CAOG_04390 [Capsaspora owczarzaki ATCC 30864]KJE93633.1 hypothetical protein CAOG_004390 [Capsaspora owczarzaki ATCC 30864]|eukprot:XP_004348218.1 hypothetical protein CAOG_04390 [Capsaspora owczarzaki ATCC 30864]